MKPHLGLLLVAALVARARWRQMLVATVITMIVWGVAEWRLGLTRAYFTAGAHVQLAVLLTRSDKPYFSAMPSTFAALRHFPFAWAAQAVVAVVALAMCWPLRRLPLAMLAFPLATATFLVLPYGFAYDMGVVGVGFAALLWDHWGRFDWPRRAIAAGGVLCATFPLAAPVLLLAGLWLQRETLLCPPPPASA